MNFLTAFIDAQKLLVVIIEAGSFIASFAAIAAGIMMTSITRKFDTGILAAGFRTIAVGIFFLAAGILIDAVTAYLMLNDIREFLLIIGLVITKEVFFVVGTYIVVIGSKKTGDKLQSLTT